MTQIDKGSSCGYWEEILSPALEEAISNHHSKLVELLLQYGEISSEIKRVLSSRCNPVDSVGQRIIAALDRKTPIDASRLDRVKILFLDLCMGVLSWLQNLFRWCTPWR